LMLNFILFAYGKLDKKITVLSNTVMQDQNTQ